VERAANCLKKLERMTKTPRHEEADRVPIGEFFWSSFVERWRRDLNLPDDTDIYSYYDLDWIVTVPSMDPHVKNFEILEENNEQVVVKTGFSAVIRKKFAFPMPEFVSWDIDTIEKLEQFEFGDPYDRRRYFEAADRPIDGMVLWGDVAYTKSMFFSPDYWRRYFQPVVTAIVETCHRHNLPVIYHGCGNVSEILEDFIKTGIDSLNPLEAKAGLDVVNLRRRLGHRLGFCGNMDVIIWANANETRLREVVLTKLNAAKGGGFIFQSDHSVPSDVPGKNYDYVIKLVREYGKYPLDLGEFDLPDLG